LDLGAGVCASLCHLARRHTIEGVGITLSPVQVKAATERILREGLSAHLRCVEADFTRLPVSSASVDAAFAIESFVHGPSHEQFFAECGRVVKPGGLLLVCDDFLAESRLREDPRASPVLERFRQGWHVSTLLTESEADASATRAGFSRRETADLSPYLELERPRDLLIGALMKAAGWLPLRAPYWRMLSGGHALQLCLKRGFLRYLLMVWERNTD
jgi:cyclopropane fatty-acyl-phospholipid synthase-like methyltransferase